MSKPGICTGKSQIETTIRHQKNIKKENNKLQTKEERQLCNENPSPSRYTRIIMLKVRGKDARQFRSSEKKKNENTMGLQCV
jgi:hypothetical protein